MRTSVIRHFFQIALSNQILRSSLAVAAAVGTVLNLINRGDALWAGRSVDALKVLLTYLVPYCVASYAGAMALLRLENLTVAAGKEVYPIQE